MWLCLGHFPTRPCVFQRKNCWSTHPRAHPGCETRTHNWPAKSGLSVDVYVVPATCRESKSTFHTYEHAMVDSTSGSVFNSSFNYFFCYIQLIAMFNIHISYMYLYIYIFGLIGSLGIPLSVSLQPPCSPRKGMLRGERRRLLVPAKLGYGRSGAPPVIPPNADLVFEVELMS